MSSSNIIKMPQISPHRVVIGPLPFNNRPRTDHNQKASGSGTRGEDPPAIEPSASQGGSLAWAAEMQTIREVAQAEAEGILRRAKEEAEDIRARAHDRGYQKGRSEGLAAAKTEMLKHSQRLGEMANGATVDMASILASAEESLVELALAIAARIVYRRVNEDRVMVVEMVRGALEEIAGTTVVQVRVNPEDLPLLQANWEEGAAICAGKNIELASDAQVQVGGCIIDTVNSVIDAQIETKLAEIERAFQADQAARLRVGL